ncbi:hypothetical protein KBJ94_29400, partial [Pseudomonas sp. ITA]|uniref:hypothetical protein n=1 Tax=Pseudomonas sp. ITA TaxID=2825841 RepID=UPI00249923E7
AGQVIAVSDLGQLTFTPLTNRNGSGIGSFTFQVRDDGGTANGGMDTDPTPNTFAFNITSVKDATLNVSQLLFLGQPEVYPENLGLGSVSIERIVQSGTSPLTVLTAINAVQWLQGSDLDPRDPILREVEHIDSLHQLPGYESLLFGALGRDLSMRAFSGVSMVGDPSAGTLIESVVLDNAIYVAISNIAGEDRSPIEKVDVRLQDGSDGSSWLQVDPRGLAIIERIAGQDELHLAIEVQHTDGTRNVIHVVIQVHSGEINFDQKGVQDQRELQRRNSPPPLDSTIITPAMKTSAEVQRLLQIF